MNSLLLDVFDRIASESSKLAMIDGRSTVTTKEIQAAVELILPGELAKHAKSEGARAIDELKSST